MPSLKKADALKLPVKSVKDTAGPSGLVPTLLVFGFLPRLPIHPIYFPEQRERMCSIQLARNYMAQAISRERVHVALKRNVPTPADSDVLILDLVLVHLERPVNKWLVPFTVLEIQGKAVFVNVNGKASRFSIDKFKPYRQEADPFTGKTRDQTSIIYTIIPVPRHPNTNCQNPTTTWANTARCLTGTGVWISTMVSHM